MKPRRTIEAGTAHPGEHASIFRLGKSTHPSPYIRPSRPFAGGERCYRIVTTLTTRQGQHVTYRTAFRHELHARAWLALTEEHTR